MFIVYSLGFWAIRSLGLWLVWVRVGVLGRKRLGPWAMLLSQNPMHKWIWVPRYRTLAPPLIHAQFSRRIKESKRHSLSEKLIGCTLGRLQKPINALSKGALYLAIQFSRHHYLTIHEPKRRGVLSQATKNKTYTPKNICNSASKDRSHGKYLAQFYAT